MKKLLPLIALGTLSGQAAADRIADNLKELRAVHVCSSFESHAYVESERQDKLSEAISVAIQEQNLLFNKPFPVKDIEGGCDIIVQLVWNGLELSDGQYVFFGEFKVVAYYGTFYLDIDDANNLINDFSIWDIRQYGLAAGRKDWEQSAIEFAKEGFRTFLLDWRKSH